MRISIVSLTTLLVGGTLLMSGCSTPEKAAGDAGGPKKVRIVATVGMIADVARNIGGDLVSVESLMGPGVDRRMSDAPRHARPGTDRWPQGSVPAYQGGSHMPARTAILPSGARIRVPVVATSTPATRVGMR